ncbi:MAG TPA: hypothetical protein VLB00_12195 [Gemmatimonadales bacterium]|nr:hypothetical protein [Gemmatimonadales bacterium]
MRRRGWGGLAGTLLCSGFLSVTCAAQPPAQAPVLTSERWREDLQYFARELEQRHKNLFHTVSRAQFSGAVRQLDSAIPSLQPHQIIVRMTQIAALVGDGHTGVRLPGYFTLYPIGVYWFGSELRVLGAATGYRRAIGARVTHIGGVPIDQVDARVRSCFPSAAQENEWYVLSTSPAFIVRPEVLHTLGVVPDLGAAPFTFEDDQGERFTLSITPIAAPPVVQGGFAIPGMQSASARQPLFRQRPGERFWFAYLPEAETVYVSFRGYQSLGENARSLFRFIDSTGARRLVIDLRQNGGGDFLEGRRHLVHPLQRHPTLNQPGRLYVIVGRRTFSAAMANAIDFKKLTKAILVGEPVGERPNSYSENDEMTLPNSEVVVSYSTRYYKFLDQDVPAFLPDVRIDPSWPDFRAGRDPVIEWILRQDR